MLRHVYTLFFYLLTPFIVLRLYWKGRRLPAYRQRIGERFSMVTSASSEVDVWLHAVSLGEVVAATPLIDALLNHGLHVLVTTMTPTGSHQVMARFGSTVSHQYIPYDLPFILKRFFRKINARVGVIMETELWPNLIWQATRFKVPLLLINARISDKSFGSYEKLGVFFKPVLRQFKAIFAQSELDARRFKAIGASIDRVHAFGNMKFDIQPHGLDLSLFIQFKLSWGESRPVLIAASTHDNEEHQLLTALTTLKVAIPNLVLLLAPRHPERFKMVYELSQQQGYQTGLRSQPDTIDVDTEVIVLDCLGELLGFYQVSNYAFVGGSLVPVGGHNVLEPIAMQVPVFCGPYMHNSKSICFDLCESDALQQVPNVDALVEGVIAMHNAPSSRLRQISHANAMLEANKGSVAKCFAEIIRIIEAG